MEQNTNEENEQKRDLSALDTGVKQGMIDGLLT